MLLTTTKIAHHGIGEHIVGIIKFGWFSWGLFMLKAGVCRRRSLTLIGQQTDILRILLDSDPMATEHSSASCLRGYRQVGHRVELPGEQKSKGRYPSLV